MKSKIKARRIIRDDDADDDDDESKSSSETVASNDHLLASILLRLPIKPLMRFKLVSKQWRSLIADPHFCRLRQSNRSPNPAVGLFLCHSKSELSPTYNYIPFSLNKPTKPLFRTLEFTTHGDGIGILHSCNGLLLCCSYHKSGALRNRRYYVYNPTTGKFSTLPNISADKRRNIRGMNLAFDQEKSPHYKVVCVLGVEAGLYRIEVYSSEVGAWRKCGEPFATAAQIDFKKGVYWNGSMHWLKDGEGEGDYDGDSLYFDLENGMARNLVVPPVKGYWHWSTYYLGESCGHLHYMKIHVESRQKFDVYEMKRDYSSWFVKYEVDLSCLFECYQEMTEYYCESVSPFSMFSVVRGERDEDSFLVIQTPGRLVKWNLVYETFELIHEFDEYDLRFFGTNGFQHIESLSSV